MTGLRKPIGGWTKARYPAGPYLFPAADRCGRPKSMIGEKP
jgi:hypothetical protein